MSRRDPSSSAAQQVEAAMVPLVFAVTLGALTASSGFPPVVAGLVGSVTGGFCWWVQSSS